MPRDTECATTVRSESWWSEDKIADGCWGGTAGSHVRGRPRPNSRMRSRAPRRCEVSVSPSGTPATAPARMRRDGSGRTK
eukprot:ctg_2954.g398